MQNINLTYTIERVLTDTRRSIPAHREEQTLVIPVETQGISPARFENMLIFTHNSRTTSETFSEV